MSGEEGFWIFRYLDSVKVRYGALYFGMILIFALVGLRLFDLQIVRHDEYAARASEERTKLTTIEASRGEIYLMDGENAVEAVVMNEKSWRVYVDPYYIVTNYANYQDAFAVELDEILGEAKTAEESWAEIWARGKERNMYTVLAKEVDYNVARRLRDAEISLPNGEKMKIQGVGLQETTKRVYPSKSLAAQVLGYDYECTDKSGKAVICRAGAEGAFDEELSGVDGKIRATYDINNVQLSIGSEYIETPAQNGKNIVLSIDVNIQRKVEGILQKKTDENAAVSSASVVVMNPRNGQVLAMANYPSFDLNARSTMQEGSDINRVTSSPYEPASMCKTFVYATALNEGAITPNSTYYNAGYTEVEDRTIYNANRSMANIGEISLQTALNYSYNTGSVEVLRRIGGGRINRQARDTYYDYLYNHFGFGRSTGFELGDAAGLVYSPEHEQGNAVRYSNMTFGQGMTATMLQMTAAFSSVVNGGQYYRPTILAGEVDENGSLQKVETKEALRQAVSAETSATMREMLMGVRSVNGGENDPAGYEIGIKTGMAETVDESGEYTSARTNVGVIGFGGNGQSGPSYVVMVRLDGNSMLWSSEAVPVFTEISNYLIQYMRIEPSV